MTRPYPAAETAPVEAADVLVPPESSPMQERDVAAEAPAAPDLLLPNAVIAIRPGGSPRPASKSDRMVETKALVDRMLELRKSHGLDLWMEVFEVFDLVQDVDLKFLESKKRAIALRLHPDKVDDQMAKYCGGRDRVYEAYYFLDEAFDQAKAWLKEHGQGNT
ncbi:ANKRD17 [Symbiodinium natans]|uniref:ANKRD17 protein n=1 Tax=Symbiodinium natans TaxID=878477 RepID=A0A812TR18_9DINO|nr:ANKRD17 [Symbiodinium natans]